MYMGDLFAGGLKPNLFQVLEIYRSCFRRGCFRGVFQMPFWGVFQYRFSAPGDCFQSDSFSRGLEVGFTTKHRIYLSLTYIYIYITASVIDNTQTPSSPGRCVWVRQFSGCMGPLRGQLGVRRLSITTSRSQGSVLDRVL